MKNTIKKMLSACLCLMMLLSCIPMQAAAATTGTCGDNLTWELSDGVLTISGTGDMNNFNWRDPEWAEYADDIYSVVVEEGVTSIGMSAFYDCYALTAVSFPDSLEKIGSGALTNTAFAQNVDNWENGLLYVGKYLMASDLQDADMCEVRDGTRLIAPWAIEGDVTIVKLPASIAHLDGTCIPYANIIFYEGSENDWNAMWEDYDDQYDTVVFNVGKNSIYENGILYDIKDKQATILYGNRPTDLVIPAQINGASVVHIADNAFKGKMTRYTRKIESVNSVTFPSSLKTIGANAFTNVLIGTMTFGGVVESIGENAFSSCEKIDCVYIPGGAASFDKIDIASGNDCLTADVFYEEYPFSNISMKHSFDLVKGYYTISERVNDERITYYELSPYYIEITRTFKDGHTDVITADNSSSFSYEKEQLSIDNTVTGENSVTVYYFGQPYELKVNIVKAEKPDAAELSLDSDPIAYDFTKTEFSIANEEITQTKFCNDHFIFYCNSGNVYTKPVNGTQITLLDIDSLLGDNQTAKSKAAVKFYECDDETILCIGYKYYFHTTDFVSYTQFNLPVDTQPQSFLKVADKYVVTFPSDIYHDVFIEPGDKIAYYVSADLQNWTQYHTPAAEFEMYRGSESVSFEAEFFAPGNKGLFVLMQSVQGNATGARGYQLQGLYYTENFTDYIRLTEDFAPYGFITMGNSVVNDKVIFCFTETYRPVFGSDNRSSAFSRSTVWAFDEQSKTVSMLYENNNPSGYFNSKAKGNTIFLQTIEFDEVYTYTLMQDEVRVVCTSQADYDCNNIIKFSTEKYCCVSVYFMFDGSVLLSADGEHFVTLSLPDGFNSSVFFKTENGKEVCGIIGDNSVIYLDEKLFSDVLTNKEEHTFNDNTCTRCGYEKVEPQSYAKGDIDGDCTVSSSDARLTLRAAVGLEELNEKQAAAADVDNDGDITSSDARFILRAAVGLETL